MPHPRQRQAGGIVIHDDSIGGIPHLIVRLRALLDALRAAPLDRPALLRAVQGTIYPDTSSARRMIDRDIGFLKVLDIVIERSHTRPPVYTLRGGVPTFDEDDLRVLALIRDTFGSNHPQTAQVQTLLTQLTSRLTDAESQTYAQQQPLRVPVQPAIDYTPYASLVERLQSSITKREIICFHYKSPHAFFPVFHRRVEPYEVEYYERQFYLVAYSHNTGIVHDFRIDRIADDETFQLLERLPPSMEHQRYTIAFRYRLASTLTKGDISQRFEHQRVVQKLPNGDVIIEAEGRSSFFIVRTLLKYSGNTELLEPEWLRKEMVKEVKRLCDLYRE